MALPFLLRVIGLFEAPTEGHQRAFLSRASGCVFFVVTG
jgi:hypothetical protein